MKIIGENQINPFAATLLIAFASSLAMAQGGPTTGAADPGGTAPRGRHGSVELVAVAGGELPQWHVAEGGKEVVGDHALPVLARRGSQGCHL